MTCGIEVLTGSTRGMLGWSPVRAVPAVPRSGGAAGSTRGAPPRRVMFRFLQRCSESGRLDLRNEISHGFVDEVHAPIAALLIQVLLFLSSLETTATTASGDPDPDPMRQRLGREGGRPGGRRLGPPAGPQPGRARPGPRGWRCGPSATAPASHNSNRSLPARRSAGSDRPPRRSPTRAASNLRRYFGA